MKLVVKVKQVEALGDRLGTLDARALSAPLIDVVNDTARDTHKKALDTMLRNLNLQRDYVEQKMTVTLARNPVTPKATIVASGKTITNLERYFRTGGSQSSVRVNWPNEGAKPSGRNPRKPGARLPWKPRVGARNLGIPVGMKQSGLKIAVTRGAPIAFGKAFLIRPKKFPNVVLVASRPKGDTKGKGKVDTKVGPSVYQMFRAALTPDFLAEVNRSLSKLVLDAAEQNIRGRL